MQVTASERFAPGRAAFVFELDRDGQSLPTTVLRSAADVPEALDVMSGAGDAALLNRLAAAMVPLKLGSGVKKLRRKDGGIAAPASVKQAAQV